MKIEIYDQAMCCSTGVCGPSVDPELVRIYAALRQIQKQAPEVRIERYGFSTDPQAFVTNAAVAELLKNKGPKCLPLWFVDGNVVGTGSYPGDEQLQAILQREGHEVIFGGQKKCGAGCC